MSRILLLLENTKNRDLLTTFLGLHHVIITTEEDMSLDVAFDLCLIDIAYLERMQKAIRARKSRENSVFLPIALVVARRDLDLTAQNLGHSVDEVILTPIEKVELQTRVETLLHTRQLSLELRTKNEDIESFIHGMSHDLRAPLRAITGFTDALFEDASDQLDAQNLSYLGKVRSAAHEMHEIIDSLLDFSRIGRHNIELIPVEVQFILHDCIRSLEQEIQARQARIDIVPTSEQVMANPTLLKMVLTNLLTNAIKFVPPNVAPHVTVTTSCTAHLCCISIQDNGIGISEEDQRKLFVPFSRLHGIEEFPGTGLGLATVRKATEIMDGHVDVYSTISEGSTFQIELRSAGET